MQKNNCENMKHQDKDKNLSLKNSNKITGIYVLSSVLLFLCLLVGGGYGIYLSIGIKFMRNNVSEPAGVDGGVSPVGYAPAGEMAQPSMIGIIILSGVLVLISFFYLASMIKQIIFFKQFKLIRESKFEKFMEGKVKSKSSVIFFAVLLNIISFIAGIAGIFINISAVIDGGLAWVLYVIDGLVAVLSLVSLILLIKKVRMVKKYKEEIETQLKAENKSDDKLSENMHILQQTCTHQSVNDIDSMEYVLLKLKNMKEASVISNDEYNFLREKMTGLSAQKKQKKSRKNNRKIAN